MKRNPARRWVPLHRRTKTPARTVSFSDDVTIITIARRVAGKRLAKPNTRPRFAGRIVVKAHKVDVKAFRNVAKSRTFLGACCDIGAQRTVIGERQAKAYCRETSKKSLSPSDYSFMFGDGLHLSLGSIEVRIPTPDGTFIAIEIDVVSADVPLLLGIDVLDREKLVADNVDNVIHSRRFGWKIPVIRRGAGARKSGHMYLVWNHSQLLWNYSQLLFSRSELKKLHLHFYHPSARKLYNLLKRADSSSVSGETLTILDDISKACGTCTVYSPGPHRFRVAIPNSQIVFNRTFALTLCFSKVTQSCTWLILRQVLAPQPSCRAGLLRTSGLH